MTTSHVYLIYSLIPIDGRYLLRVSSTPLPTQRICDDESHMISYFRNVHDLYFNQPEDYKIGYYIYRVKNAKFACDAIRNFREYGNYYTWYYDTHLGNNFEWSFVTLDQLDAVKQYTDEICQTLVPDENKPYTE